MTAIPASRPPGGSHAGDSAASDEEWRGIASGADADRDSPDVSEEDSTSSGRRRSALSSALLRQLLRPHRWGLLLAAVVIIADQAVSIAGPLLIAYAIDTAVPALSNGDGGPLRWAVLGYLAAGAASAGTRLLFVRLSARLSQRVLRTLRAQVFAHAQALSVAFHERYTSGRVIARLTSDVETIGEALEEGVNDLVVGFLSVVVTSALLVWLDPTMGGWALVAFIPLWLLTRWFQRGSLAIYRGSRSAIAALIVQFTETLNGIRAVQSFRREPRNQRIFATENERFAQAEKRSLVLAGIYSPAIRLIGNVTLSVILVVGAMRVIDGTLAIGVLAAFLLYLRRVYDPMDELAMFYNQFQSAGAALEKIAALLAQVPSVPEPAEPRPLAEPHGELWCHGVAFAYTTDRPVIAPMDLHIPAGQTIALVGATGAGKSTLGRLLARFYDPTSGVVTLDGVDLRELTAADLRRAVVMVTQESFLFSGSVADNIGLGNPAASRIEIERAAEAVGAAGFIRRLPHGYDTDVRKRGGRLSAGQRQLVAFARALLADPAVLILDEATAALDIPSERAVQAALGRVLHGRTAVIIAHRLSTVAIADRVLVMDQGRIVEDGSADDLIAGSGRFAALELAWRESLV